MSEEAPKKKSWIRRLFKFSIFLAVLLIVVFTVLANVGGNKEGYRKAVEEFLSDFTGLHAELTTLNNMTFFPDISFDFEDAQFFASAESEVPVASVGRVAISLSFFDMMMQAGKIKYLLIENLSAKEGEITKSPLFVESVIIDAGDNDKGAIIASGLIGAERFDAAIDMQAQGQGHKRKFFFGETRPFVVSLGKIFFAGEAKDSGDNGIVLNDVSLIFEDQDVFTGHIEYDENDLEGTFLFSQNQTSLTLDLEHGDAKNPSLDGEMESECYHPADLADGSLFAKGIYYLYDLFYRNETHIQALDVSKVTLEIDQECDQALQKSDITLPFGFENNIAIDISE